MDSVSVSEIIHLLIQILQFSFSPTRPLSTHTLPSHSFHLRAMSSALLQQSGSGAAPKVPHHRLVRMLASGTWAVVVVTAVLACALAPCTRLPMLPNAPERGTAESVTL